jgi:glyoxalase family protein
MDTLNPRTRIQGLHHVTAIAGEAQANYDFYVSLLGLRMVKKTINYDDPFTYHLYYGDGVGSPGTLMTFFPWAKSFRGRVGAGITSSTSFAVPPGSLPFWNERLTADADRRKSPGDRGSGRHGD